MDCNEARSLLDAAMDRELSATEARRVEQHVAACFECRREAQALRAVSQATREAEYFAAPDALRARIVAALPSIEPATATKTKTVGVKTASAAAEPAPAQPSRTDAPAPEANAKRPRATVLDWASRAWRTPRGPRGGAPRAPAAALGWPMGLALAAMAIVATVASLGLLTHRPGSVGAPFVDELVASHVRAQLSGHDIDVVSTDQHTVKPWFNGKLDYAPPVEDLAENGFALTGGRLDYVGHRRVAVLVYRYRKHIVDLYVMPEADADARRAPAALTSDGYALDSWRGHGMIWWAVSDAEPAVLAQLHSALAARLDRPQAGPPQ